MNKLKILFWISIIFIVFISRFYQLELLPPHLTIDEVSIGYNAYSILQTAHDEWGNFLPASFRSVGDFKAPVLIYLTVPFVWIFGLTEVATRLPVAIFSAVNVYLFWLLVSRYVFSKHKTLPYLTTFIFSLSPWMIPFSRSGFEAIPALTFLLVNLLFAFQFRHSRNLKHFFFMVFFAFLSAITYHSNKLVVPLLNLFILYLIFPFFIKSISDSFKKNKIVVPVFILFFLLLTFFFIQNYVLGPGSSRASMTILAKDFDFTGGMLPVFESHPLPSMTSIIGLIALWYKRILEYFSANFYLSSGLGLAIPGHPGQGVIYTIEYPFMIVGFLILLLTGKYFSSNPFLKKVLLVWLFLSFLPASITNNSQHALRSLSAVPLISVLVGIGLVYIFEHLKPASLRYLLGLLIIFGYVFGTIRFADYYTLHYPVELSEARSYGWKQMALYAWDHHTEYDNVYVDPRFGTDGPYTYGVPYLYFLFYSQYDPSQYMNDPRREAGGTDFENYVFTNIDWSALDHSKHNLYIASPWSFPKELLGSEKQKLYVPFLNQSSGLYAISD